MVLASQSKLVGQEKYYNTIAFLSFRELAIYKHKRQVGTNNGIKDIRFSRRTFSFPCTVFWYMLIQITSSHKIMKLFFDTLLVATLLVDK